MTHSIWPGGRLARVFAAALMLAATITTFGLARALAAPAAGCHNWTGTQPPNPGVSNTLDSVAILSACDAWAVGFQTGSGILATLTEHWNGSTWSVVPSPNPGPSVNLLRGVRGTSPSDVWAVGSYSDGTMEKSLILHWDGRTWTQVPSPNPGTVGTQLFGVRAMSGTDAWAVGDADNGTADHTLILRWDGQAWTQAASPSPAPSALLSAIAATSATDAWAVGSIFPASGGAKTLTLHWNGTKWAQVASPNQGTNDRLFGVRNTSSTDAWAVGVSVIGGDDQTLALHWNGSTWARVATPSPGGPGFSSSLVGVAGTSATNVWAGRQHRPHRQRQGQGHHQHQHPDPALGRLPVDPRAQPQRRDQRPVVRGGRLLRQQHLGCRNLQRWHLGPYVRRPLLLAAPIMPRQRHCTETRRGA